MEEKEPWLVREAVLSMRAMRSRLSSSLISAISRVSVTCMVNRLYSGGSGGRLGGGGGYKEKPWLVREAVLAMRIMRSRRSSSLISAISRVSETCMAKSLGI